MTTAGARGRFVELDGLRGVAILLVILAHFPLPIPGGGGFTGAMQTGALGVNIFFVLSGFIITHLLLQEEATNGRISLKGFYFRRALRILPPLFLYLGALAMLNGARIVVIPWSDFAAGLFFVRNYAGVSLETGHLWTLAIEEQFYLVAPLLLVLVRHTKARIIGCALLFALSTPWRQWIYHLAGGAEQVNSGRTDFRIEPLMLGALLALLRSTPAASRWLATSAMSHTVTAMGAVVLLWLISFTPLASVRILRAFAPGLSFLCIGILLNHTLENRESWLKRSLRMAPLTWLGHLSYSLYLWQQLFAPFTPGGGWWREFPWHLMLALACACLSFHAVERPLMRWRASLHPEGRGQTPASAGP
jgi:peptidoglycan/LPS O-acetylase OafA/YrhL